MIPDTEEDIQIVPRKRSSAISIQRFPHGSPATNTVNTPPLPPPCFVNHLLIREEWASYQAEKKKADKVHRDPAVILKEIEKHQAGLDKANNYLDKIALSEDSKYDALSKKFHRAMLEIQGRMIKLEMERIAAQSSLAPYKAPEGKREFIIVREKPPGIEPALLKADEIIESKGEKLKTAYKDWEETHNKHETVKKQLTEHSKEKAKLAAARDKARSNYEASIRAEKQKRENKATADARQRRTFKELRVKIAKKRLKSAEKRKSGDKTKFLEAKKAHDDFARGHYLTLKETESRLYEELMANLKAIHQITKEINVVEEKIKSIKNILLSGSTIQMTSFEIGIDPDKEEDIDPETKKRSNLWTHKVPSVGLLLNGETPFPKSFPPKKTFCRDDPPVYNGPARHPHLNVTEPESKLDENIGGRNTTTFKIYESHRKFFAPTKTIGFAAFGRAIKGIVAAFRHIFSIVPKKRYYDIVAETCGVSPYKTDVPDKLEAKLEVFPADSYTIAIKVQPAFGFSGSREETLSNTTGVAGEVAGADVENAGSTNEHNVTTEMSSSVLGVTQSSTSTTRTTDPEGRDITTTTTKSREGFYGTLTTTSSSSGTLIREDSEGNTYASETSSTTVLEGRKLVSLDQTYKDETGRTIDGSKAVDDQGVATAITDDYSGADAGTRSARAPVMPPSFLPQIPVDIVLTRNGVEEPITEDLRRTLGLILFLVKKFGEMVGRLNNLLPSVGWKIGFNVSFLAGELAYTHDHREHTDYRVWLHHKFDIDLNLVTAKIFISAGASLEVGSFFTFEICIELYIKGIVSIKGEFEKTHPDAKKKWEIGFSPTGSIGTGAEARAIIGQPDWLSASGSIETAVAIEATWWAMKEGEDAPYLDAAFNWKGVTLKGTAYIALVGSWEKSYKLCDEKELWSGRFPEASESANIEKMLEDQNRELSDLQREQTKKGKKLEKKILKKKGRLPRITN